MSVHPKRGARVITAGTVAHTQLLDAAEDLFYLEGTRNVGIDAVDVIEVDDVGFEPFQALVAALLEVFRAPVGEARAALQRDIAELAGDHVIAAMAGDTLTDQAVPNKKNLSSF